MSKKKKIILIIRISLLVIVAVGAVIGFKIVNEKITKKQAEEFTVQQNNGSYNIGIDELYVEGKELKIKGWCFIKNGRTIHFDENIKLAVILRNENDHSDLIRMTTDRYLRPELNEMFTPKSGVDYKYSGVEAEESVSRFDMEHGSYEVFVFYDIWDGDHGYYGITTDYKMVNGKLVNITEG